MLMSKKDYLEFIFFMCCTLITLMIMKLIWSMDNCLVGNINRLLDLSLIDLFWSYCLYFLLGILPFGWSFVLYNLLKKVSIINKFFSQNNSRNIKIRGLKETYIHNTIFTLTIIPFPLIIYDLLLC